jgi:hypothetical protein
VIAAKLPFRNHVCGAEVITQEITIRVHPQAAAVYLGASDQERRKLYALLSLRLNDAAARRRPLQEIIQEASREAQAKGLTPEILQEILDEE